MQHSMKLNHNPFSAIKNGTKIVEMRLYDEKRQLINSGDIIEFTERESGEMLRAEVIETAVYKDFKELYSHYNKIAIGYKENENANPNDMSIYYPKEAIDKYGVIAITIKVL